MNIINHETNRKIVKVRTSTINKKNFLKKCEYVNFKNKYVDIQNKIGGMFDVDFCKHRSKLYYVARKYLERSSTCIMFNDKTNQLQLGNYIQLKDMEFKYSNNLIYLSDEFAVKIVFINMTTEIRILKLLTVEVLSGKFINFPLLYKIDLCENINNHLLSRFKDKYMILISEKLNGTLYDLATDTLDDNVSLSCMFQSLFAIYKLQEIGFVHSDIHPKNLLYITIASNNWLWYKFFDQSYYIFNPGHLWILWDFENSYEVENKNIDINADLRSLFGRIANLSSNYSLQSFFYDVRKQINSEPTILTKLMDIFLKNSLSTLYVTQSRPDNVFNLNPFIIA